jgi:hypothetical protein
MAESHSLTDDVTFTALLPQEKKFLFISKITGMQSPGSSPGGFLIVLDMPPRVLSILFYEPAPRLFCADGVKRRGIAHC